MIYTCIYIYIHIYIYTHTHSLYVIHTHIYIYIFTLKCKYEYIHIHIHCIYTYKRHVCTMDRCNISLSPIYNPLSLTFIYIYIIVYIHKHTCLFDPVPCSLTWDVLTCRRLVAQNFTWRQARVTLTACTLNP